MDKMKDIKLIALDLDGTTLAVYQKLILDTHSLVFYMR